MEGLGERRQDNGRDSPNPPAESTIAQLAFRQHGVVAHWQLSDLQIKASTVRARVAAGRWRRVHVGVYVTGHARLSLHGCWMAAVLACGRDSSLSHRSGAHLRGLRASSRSAVDVMSPGRGGRGRPGIDVHRGGTLAPYDVELVEGIPCTSVARTLLDLAEVVDRRAVERACERAQILRVLDMRALDDVLARADGRHGAPLLAAVLSELALGSTLTRTSSRSASWRCVAATACRGRRATPGSRSVPPAGRRTFSGAPRDWTSSSTAGTST